MPLQDKQVCVDVEKLCVERDAYALREKELERDLEIKRLQHQFEMRKVELQFTKEREERQFQLKKLELEAAAKTAEIPPFGSSNNEPVSTVMGFDVFKNIRMVPLFSERECVLTGRAQEVYSALTLEKNCNYETIKNAILQAYELAPEAYRQRFLNFMKPDRCSYLEFSREKENMFDRWCISVKVTTKEQLRELILLEEFKRCQKASKVSDAALMADEFVLTHRGSTSHFNDLSQVKPRMSRNKVMGARQNGVSSPSIDHAVVNKHVKGEMVLCFYCKRAGHKVSDCLVLKKKEKYAKTVGLISTSCKSYSPNQIGQKQIQRSDISEAEVGKVRSHNDYAPFLTEGTVSLPGSEKSVPVCILRDTGAAQSFLLGGLLPLTDRTATGNSVLVRGFEMGFVEVPLHRISLTLKLVSGNVVVGIRAMLPVPGVTFILGNDLAGGNVWEKPDSGVPPILTPIVKEMDEIADCPDLFPACVITRAKAKKMILDEKPVIDENGEKSGSISESSFHCDGHDNVCSLSPLYSITRDDLIKEQQSDDTLQGLFSRVDEERRENYSFPLYFLRDGLLCRKPSKCTQMTGKPNKKIPLTPLQSIAAQYYKRMNWHPRHIVRDFEILCYIRSCHVCQMTGKPNQKIPLAPLQPIAAVKTPFEYLIVDCVGPLPRSKAGHAYLLTIMCQSTRYPAAYPLRSITAKSILKALTNFMSIFGIPKNIQSDRVMQQLKITRNISSAYHPQSQGALERFHQTLKSLLRSYCVELDSDWEEGLPWMLLAIREVVQESLGFSPNKLVFGHTVRGPIATLTDTWDISEPPTNVLDYVNSFRYRLYEARAIAQRKLGKSQEKMRKLFDSKVKFREFQVGDKVLSMLPVLTSPFQARFTGPYTVAKCLPKNNYMLNTPDRRKKLQVCHINLLKLYLTPVTSLFVDVISTTSFIDQGSLGVSGELVENLAPVGMEEISGPSRGVVEGRLNNSEIFANLAHHLSHLSEAEKVDIVKLVGSFPSLFSDVLTRTHLVEHDIDVGTAQPVKQHAYRVNPVKRELLQKEVYYLLAHNLAEPSYSSWSSPCILVSKPDNSYRFCTDYRKLNSLTKPDCYPLPRIDDCVDRVGSAEFVSKFDLLKGYWQVPLISRAKEMSAFVTPDSFLQYTVMPFGVHNAPATFQRLINQVLSGLSGCEAYLDDVVLFSSSWSEHLDQIRELFIRLTNANLTINLAKCDFGKATVNYLGKVVGQGCVRPIDAKVEAISRFPIPATRRELHQYLGMVGYYRGFCRNFESVVAPLTDLLSPKKLFVWSKQCQSAFDNAKALLANSPVLVAPNFQKPFLLAVDASACNAGAVLLQKDTEGIEHPVCYFSKKFNRHQQVYSTIEKEALALVLAVQHFEIYLSSPCGPIVVYTDHNPLIFLDRMRGKNQRIMRWSLTLQPFHLQIKHIRGQDNLIADALSRVW
ncbi:hypothetical protein IRJ41_012050 [Triplophysa rosa]|uniref:ribonuclease H n=1 Tax=Triplophysa rosa TaxID=992332 RepID=A0A9W7T4K0_TRIRA|nr:hypothetical protein IRJ41_012050 [Triplophysa rosa]